MGGAWVISDSLSLGLSRAARRSSGRVRCVKHRGGELGIGIKPGHDFSRVSWNIKEKKKVQSLRLKGFEKKKKKAKVNWNKIQPLGWMEFPYICLFLPARNIMAELPNMRLFIFNITEVGKMGWEEGCFGFLFFSSRHFSFLLAWATSSISP